MGQLMGFAVLAWPITLLVIFLLVFVGVVSIVLYANRNKKSGWKWGLGAALLVYLAVFWDHIPTVVAHRYYCEKEAGFWVYKTLDQWKAENPGVMEELHPNLSTRHISDGDQYILDDRFSIQTRKRTPVPGLSTQITEWVLVDQKTNEALAREVTVGSGQGNLAAGGGYKFWLSMKPCRSGGITGLSIEIEKMRGKK